jgi:hypothetical protein
VRVAALAVLAALAFGLGSSDAAAQVPPTDYCDGTIRRVAVNVQGAGSVTARMYGTPASCVLDGPVCASSCSFRVQNVCEYHCRHRHNGPLPGNVELVPQAAAGSHFLGWTATCVPIMAQPTTSCNVRMSADQTATARFGPAPDPAAPSAPVVSATRGSYAVALSWTPSTDETWLGGYDVVSGSGALLSRQTGTGPRQYTVGGLRCETAYVFHVVAFDALHRTDSGPLAVTTADCDARTPVGPAPNTVLHVKPARNTRSRRAYFHWGSNQTRVTYQCRLDRGRWTACRPGKTYRNLRRGTHTFRVRARSRDGRFDRTPATWRWRIR